MAPFALLTLMLATDPSIQARLTSGNPARLLVAFKDVKQTDLTSLNPDHYRVVARFEAIPAAILETQSLPFVEELEKHPSIAAVELDSGGYGMLVPPVAVQKVARIAILDTGLPNVEQLASSQKLAAEYCYCQFAGGRGCCPDGSAYQEGLGAATQDLQFDTSSLLWLKLSKPSAVSGRPMVDWEPFVTVYKTQAANDAFDSWEAVLRSADHLLTTASQTRQDLVLFSFASARIYRSPCENGASALERIWQSILASFAALEVKILLAPADGGPGPGKALPACFERVASTERIASVERYPLADPTGGGSVGGPAQGPPPVPIQPNGTVAYGVVESVRAAAENEVPAVDTLGPVKWMVVKAEVRQALPAREGLAQMLESGRSAEFLTLDSALAMPGTEVKFSATLTGLQRNGIWFASDWRPIAAAMPDAMNLRKPRR